MLLPGPWVNAQDAPAASDPVPGYYKNSIGIDFENDMFNSMDWYFSNGLSFSFDLGALEKSPVNYLLPPFHLKDEERAVYGLRLRQEIYTPKDLNHSEIQQGDHPYAATLSLEEVKTVLHPSARLRIHSGLRIGLIGPAALGFQAQNFIHRITPSEPPKGWDNQIGNDLMLNYSVATDIELLRDEVSQLSFYGRARLGTVYTDATLGIHSRLESNPKYYSHAGTDPGRRVNFSFHLGLDLRFVGYDASLQGGLFNTTSPYTIPSREISRVVAGTNIAAVLEIQGHQVSLYQQVVSRRFFASDWHAWMGIGYRYWW